MGAGKEGRYYSVCFVRYMVGLQDGRDLQPILDAG
jgi:hypothetical protein